MRGRRENYCPRDERERENKTRAKEKEGTTHKRKFVSVTNERGKINKYYKKKINGFEELI